MLFYVKMRCWDFLKTVSLCLSLFLSDKKVWSSKWQCVQLSGITGELQIPIFGKNLEDCDPPPAIVLNDTLLTLTYWQGNDPRGMASWTRGALRPITCQFERCIAVTCVLFLLPFKYFIVSLLFLFLSVETLLIFLHSTRSPRLRGEWMYEVFRSFQWLFYIIALTFESCL